MADFYDDAYRFVIKMEDEIGVKLSYEAKQILILPLLEVFRMNENRRGAIGYSEDFMSDWRNSVEKLIVNVKDEPAKIDRFENDSGIRKRSSISVIKAFANKFCNIPPFCGER